MARCDQELCEHWTGDGCACDVFGIERNDRAEATLRKICERCVACETCVLDD